MSSLIPEVTFLHRLQQWKKTTIILMVPVGHLKAWHAIALMWIQYGCEVPLVYFLRLSVEEGRREDSTRGVLPARQPD